jgi:glutathione synthase/RimK-type ligase-like ATP-grasp enzyme
MVNSPKFTEIASSKLKTSLLLPQHFKPYHKISNQAGLEKAFSQIKGKYIVLKPDIGSGGTGVIIETPEKVRQLNLDYPLILQEFIDSSRGIPGITQGPHDLRLVFINDDLIYSYIRVPKEGSFLANVAQGGSMATVDLSDLPDSLAPLIRDVAEAFSAFPKKIYTIDIMFDENVRPWIVELNTMPGIYFSPNQKETCDHFYSKLIQELKTL